MVTFSTILANLLPDFQDHGIYEMEYLKNGASVRLI